MVRAVLFHDAASRGDVSAVQTRDGQGREDDVSNTGEWEVPDVVVQVGADNGFACYVTPETGREIEAALRNSSDAWITFPTLWGDPVILRARSIQFLTEETPESRERYRAYMRARKAERKAADQAAGWQDD